ncbi:unnamed protein product [Oreochromis niloticus]|nr:unnamed protein product [Mustela putorius furo]
MVRWCGLVLTQKSGVVQLVGVEEDPCVTAMFAAMQVCMGNKLDIVLSSDVHSEEQTKEWSDFYKHLDISLNTNMKKTDPSFLDVDEADIVYGTMDDFVSDYVQRGIEAMETGNPQLSRGFIIEKQSLSALHALELSRLKDDDSLVFAAEVLQNLMTERKWFPRTTQMISWCLLALSDTGKLLEMGTGEGKSCVIAMFAVLRVLRGEKVDVVSSSSVLCQRDAEEWAEFYQSFGITVDTNTNKNEDKDRKECYQKDVVYGTIEAFAADHLRQIFEMKDVRPDRNFQCIIIDEVDSLLLDQGVQLTYLSSPMVSMQHLNIILTMIWSHVSQHGFLSTGHQTFVRGPPASFFKAIYDSMNTEDTEINDPMDILGIAEESNIVPKGFTEDMYKSQKDELLSKLKTVSQDAMVDFFKEIEDYVPYGFTVYTLDDKGQLCLQKCSPYNDQDIPELLFLVLEEGLCCPLYESEEVLIKPIAELISERIQYTPCENNKDKISIPGFLKNLVEKKVSVWVQNAFLAMLLKQGREYVVENDNVCPVDFRSTAKEIYEELKSCIPSKRVILYCRSDRDRLSNIDKELLPGDVIVATNLASRGTDIKVSREVNNNGGLFVILSFLSENTRMELQAFGRTARKGKPGSAQIIISTEHLQPSFSTVSSLEEAKSTRDRLAAEKISHMMNDVAEMKLREDLFSEYCETLQDIYNTTDGDEERAVVAIMNEFWGFWLQTKSEEIDQLKRNELEESLKADLSKAKGTILDIRVLSEATGTKVVILTEDSNGRLTKMQELSPDTRHANQTVTLIYRPKSHQYPDGHYDVHINNQTVSIDNKGKSCLFYALACGMKPQASEKEVTLEANRLRSVEADTLLSYPAQWEPFIKQKELTETIRGGDWYMLEGAGASHKRKQRVTSEISWPSRKIQKLANTCKKKIKGTGKFINADHQPPVTCIFKARKLNQNSRLAEAMLEVATNSSTGNISDVDKYHGRELPTVYVPAEVHREFPSTKSPAFRDLLAKTISSNDVVGTFKLTILGSMPKFWLDSSRDFKNFQNKNISKSRLKDFENSFPHHSEKMVNKWFDQLKNKGVMTDDHLTTINNWIANQGYKDQNDPHRREVANLL